MNSTLSDVVALPSDAGVLTPHAPPTAPRVSIARLDRSVFRTVVTLGGIQAFAIMFTVARSKAVALTLGPSGIGAISLIDQIVGLATQIATFSLPYAAVKFLSAAHSESRDRFAGLYAAFVWALLLLSSIAACAGFTVLVWRPSVLGRELAAYGTIAAIAFLTIPGTTLTGFLTNAIASTRRVTGSSFYGLASVITLAVLSAAGVVLAGLRGYYIGSLIAVSVVTVVGMRYMSRSEGAQPGAPQTGLHKLQQCGGVAGFASALYIASFAMPIAQLIARYAILDAMGLEGAGLLQSATALGLALFLVMRQSNMLFLTPALNRSVPDEQKFDEAANYLRAFSIVVGVTALPLVLFPDLWLYILYSRRFLAAAPHTYMFVLAQVLQLFAGVSLGLLIGLNRVFSQLAITLGGLVVLALCSVLLAPRMGIAGIGSAFLAEGVLVMALSTWYLWRKFHFSILHATDWLPVGVLAVLALIGSVAPRYPGGALHVVLLKGMVLLALTSGALVVAWRQGLLQEWRGVSAKPERK